jgi:hypothetical protein
MMRVFLAIAGLLGLLSSATAQPVQQSGSVTPGHPAGWQTNGVLFDGGTPAQGLLTGLGVTTSGPGICQNSGPITGPYNQVCLGVTQTGGATLSINNFGGASGGFTLSANGVNQGLVTVNLPTTTGGNVCFANTTGTLKDCIGGGSFVSGPVSSTNGAAAVWNGTLGSALSDSKVVLTVPATIATLTIANNKTFTVNNTLTLSGTDTKSLILTNGLTVSGNDGTLAFDNTGKTLHVANSLVLAGVDGNILTLGSSLTITNQNAGTITFGAVSKTLTISSTGSLAGGDNWQLAIAANKTFTVSNSLTLAGTDGTTMTFPGVSDTVDVLGTAQTITAVKTFTPTQAPNTSVDSLALVDPTAATTGNQQFSPRLRLTGQGFKTQATAGSQPVDWIIENQPIQALTAPTTNLVFSSQINGAGYTANATFNSVGGLGLTALGIGSGTTPATGIQVFNAAVTPTGNGQGSIGASASLGLLLTGQGSSVDIQLVNKIGTNVCSIATGTSIFSCLNIALTNPLGPGSGGTGVANTGTITVAGNFTIGTNGGQINFPSASTTMTMPAASDTLAGLGTTQTFTKPQTWNIATTVASATGANLDDLNVQSATATITGGTTITRFSKASIYQPTFTGASAAVVTDASSLFIQGAPLTGGSVTFSNAWSFLVGAGATKLQATTINGLATFNSNLNLPNGGIIYPQTDSTTALKITNNAQSSTIINVDTTNLRVGINKTPGNFTLDVNGTIAFVTLDPVSLTSSTTTITGLTQQNAVQGTDLIPYYSQGDGKIRQATVASVVSGATAGVGTINGGSGTVVIQGGTGISFTPASGAGTNPTFTAALTSARQTLPTTQRFTSGSGTYTLPANVLWIELWMTGGGGGGSGSGTGSPGAGNPGGDTCWRASGAACTTPLYDAGAGGGGTFSTGVGGAGGTISGTGTCTDSTAGSDGAMEPINNASGGGGGAGGTSRRGGAGARQYGAATGSAGAANSGSGGQGAPSSASFVGAGGASGATCYVIIGTPSATYTYVVGASGSGGTAGTSGQVGGAGGAGNILVIEHYGT